MKKDSVILDMISIQDRYQNIIPSKFIAHRNIELNIDSLKLIVKNYKLPQKEGLGLVVIVEMFNKPEIYISGYITFFDIATRVVYYATKMKGLPGSKWGFNDYWFNGLTELYDYFVKYYYPKTVLK